MKQITKSECKHCNRTGYHVPSCGVVIRREEKDPVVKDIAWWDDPILAIRWNAKDNPYVQRIKMTKKYE